MSYKADTIDFAGMMKNAADLINAVMQTNLRAAQELMQAENHEAVLELQQRFIRDYMATLMQGTLTLVDTITAAAANQAA